MRLSIRFAAMASALALATAPAIARPMVIDDVPNISSAGELVSSADGETIAYTVFVQRDLIAGDKDGPADSHIYVKREGERPVLFVGGLGAKSGLQFSPLNDGVFFQMQRTDDTVSSLYVIPLYGGEAQKIYEHETAMGDYALSPDAKTVYFLAAAKDDSDPALIEQGFKAYAYEENIAMASVWKVDIDAEFPEAELLYEGVDVNALELSSDGQTLVLSVAPTPLVDDFYMESRLHIIDAESGERRAIVGNPGKLGTFKISPDNDQIAFLAGTDIGDTSTGVLMIADMNDGSFEQLTPDALQHIQDIEWLQNNRILANAHRSVETALVEYDTSGRERRTYPTPEDIAVRDIVVSGDGDIFYTADSPAHPREVFSQNRRSSEKLTNHNEWLSEITLAPQTTFSYTARDGRTIDGLLITPLGEAPEGGWPLILTVHGGPEAHYSDGWLTAYSVAGQFGAGSGYAVYYPNYRGSTGRGVAFAKEHQDDYAGKEFNDLVDGVEALSEAGIINRDRVGITGGSYGGYASMWGATALTDHFAASVAFVGISNQLSKFGTSDIPKEMHLVHSLRWPWEDNWMNLLERSPIFHAGKSTTPTLIMHGEKDTRVHPSQSMELYRAMKVRTDTPIRLVFYPDEGHGNRMAAARLDYSYRLMRWMNTYLTEGANRSDPMPEFDLGLEEKLNIGSEDEAAEGVATQD